MSTAELVQEIKRLSNPERLKVIEAATALIREDLLAASRQRIEERAVRMRAAAIDAQSLYVPGGELGEWTALDADVMLDYTPGETKDAVKG